MANTENTFEEGLPDSWSDGARATFTRVLGEHPDMDASNEASLWQACALEATADALDALVRAQGQMILGSTGQEVLHPGINAATNARVQSAKIFTSLGFGRSSASAAGSRLSQKRWSGASGASGGPSQRRNVRAVP